VTDQAVWPDLGSCPAGYMASAGLRWWRRPFAVATDEKDLKMPSSTSTKKAMTRPASKSLTSKLRSRKGAADRTARTGSKQEVVLVQLKRPTGTTIAAIMKATGWQQHSVRGFLAGVVRKRLGLNLDSQKVDGARVYRIASADNAKSSSRQSKQTAA
jgi:hypothetical protein